MSVSVTAILLCQLLGEALARGFAAGLASHGIGAARAFQVHPTAGAFAGVAMGLNALFTALIAPFLVRLLLD